MDLFDLDFKEIADHYHWRIYHEEPHWLQTTWRGVQCLKIPSDMIMLAQVIHKVKPDYIIETGCANGGSTLFLRDMATLVKPTAQVHTIDLKIPEVVKNVSGITWEEGNSIDFKKDFPSGSTILVNLDSDHSKEHVLQEMEVFGPLVTPDSYMIIEDTNINGHPVWPNWGPGPMEAVTDFLSRHSEFHIDKDCEKFGVTFFPGGWLKRV